MLGLFLGLSALAAPAAQVNKVELLRNHQATRLILRAGSPFEFQVDLADPQTILLRLPGSEIKAALPSVKGDPLLASLQVKPGADGAELVVRTKAPGMTVLPFYEAATRTLTLEVGGSPSVEVQVPQAESAPKAGAPPRAKPPKPAQPPAAPPAPAGPAPAVAGIRMGAHRTYTRLVLDADRPLKPLLAAKGEKLVLGLERGALLPKARVARPDGRVRGLKILKTDPLRLELTLSRPLGNYNMFPLEGGRRLVLDISLAKPGRKTAKGLPSPEELFKPDEAKPKAGPQLAQAAKPRPGPPQPELAPKKLDVAPEMPVMEPKQVPQVSPNPQPGTPPDPSAPAAPASAPQAVAPPPPPMIQQASLATPVADQPYLAKGKMPPIPPPPALARPRGKFMAQASPAEKGAPEQAAPAPEAKGLDEVMAKVKQAQAERPGVRPPQGAYLGPKGKKERLARDLFDQAKEALDTRQYERAYDLFERFLKEHPRHKLAAEATFRVADAFFYLNSKNIDPAYQDVMEKYQRAVDLYPDSDQVPWAFTQMGKAAMLAGEPYRAVGYYELVAEDYPKSEYVPLALVAQGRAYVSQGKYLKALDEFRKVADNYPDSRYRKDADWGQAQALFGMSRFERASLLLKDMDRRYPDLRIKEPELLYYIGEAEFQLKNYLQARRYFLWALNIMPNIPDNDIILARVGDTYQFEGAYKAAKEIYRQVINLFPGTDGALVAQIRVAESPVKDQQHPWDIFQVKATTEALKVYQEIIEKYSNRPVAELAMLKLGVYYYKSNRYAKSLEILNRLVRSKPRTNFRPEADYAMNLAAVALLGELQKADKPLELMNAYLKYRGIISRPNSNEMLTMLAWAYSKAGLAERAANLYRVLLDRGVKDPTLRVRMAENLLKDLNYKGAIEALKGYEALGLSKQERINVLVVLARANMALGNLKTGITLFAELAKQDSRRISARDQFGLGKAFAKLGQYDKSLASLDKAADLFALDSDPRAMVYRFLVNMQAGQVAQKAGKNARALAYYQTASRRATSTGDRSQALYSVAQVYKADGNAKMMVQTLERIRNLSAAPWAQMAARYLEGLKLAPQLAKVGK